MSELLRSYLTVGIFGVAAIAMAGAMLTIARILRPQRPTPQKLIAYESGVDPVGGDWAQSQIRYYVFAVLFVLFDVEAVFHFPMGDPARGVRDLRPSRNGYFHLHSCSWPFLCVA